MWLTHSTLIGSLSNDSPAFRPIMVELFALHFLNQSDWTAEARCPGQFQRNICDTGMVILNSEALDSEPMSIQRRGALNRVQDPNGPSDFRVKSGPT